MNFTRIKLYHCPITRSSRVKWLLHELLGDDFDVEMVPLYDGVQYTPDYLKKNPNHSVPTLEFTLENGDSKIMLESGAMVSLLADLFPQKKLAPNPTEFSIERADYLQMLHFATSQMDMMLWQIRVHTHLLGNAGDSKTIKRYEKKFMAEVEPQLLARFARHDFICSTGFSAADCVMGQNVLWAQAYGLCQHEGFSAYIERVSQRPAFAKAYADMGEFTVAPPPEMAAALAQFFSG